MGKEDVQEGGIGGKDTFIRGAVGGSGGSGLRGAYQSVAGNGAHVRISVIRTRGEQG